MTPRYIAVAAIALLAAASGASAQPPPPAQVYPTNNTWNGCLTQL